jgi:hypothetical protein
MATFKEQRAVAIEYFEPQFKRINEAIRYLMQEIKENRTPDGALRVGAPDSPIGGDGVPRSYYYDASPRHVVTLALTTLTVRLEDCAEALKRNTPIHIQADIRVNQRN